MLHLLEHSAESLVEALRPLGVQCSLSEARRALSAAWARASGEEQRTRPLSKALLAALDQHTHAPLPQVLEQVPSAEDGSVRLLSQAEDGALIETVLIPLEQPGACTVCVSTQAGCAMGCDFCATGRLGLRRHLRISEIVGQVMLARRLALYRVKGVVFMGQGEPLHNYEGTLGAALRLSDPNGGRIAAEAITISTVGLVPQIRRYTAEGHRFRLIVSLTSAVPQRRATLLPIASRWPLAELSAAVAEHAQARRERVTLAWVLLSGVNTGADEVQALAEFIGETRVRLNLIDVNESRPNGFQRASDEERDRFIDALQALHIPIVRRFSVGRSQHSACGMLAARRLAELNPAAVAQPAR